MESFKQVHSTNENLVKSVKSVQELSKDIRSMESEKDQLNVKLSTVKRKVSDGSQLIKHSIEWNVINLELFAVILQNLQFNLTL